jgi:dUTP pyrophosphatase
MQTLNLDARFFPALASGQKRVTVRAGHRDIQVGELIFQSVAEEPMREFPVTVTSVEYTEFDKLTDSDAVLDCEENAENLKKTLLQFYPSLGPSDEVTVVHFRPKVIATTDKKSEKVPVKFKKLHPEAVIPKFQHKGDAGFDFHAIINECLALGNGIERCVHIFPHETAVIETGLAVELPHGYELQIRPRSGLAMKQNLTVLNSPSTIDCPYRGQLKILLHNTSRYEPRTIKHGDRVAQGVVNKLPEIEIIEVDELSDSERGTGGFGSTGI